MFVDVRRDELISALKRVKGFTDPKHEVLSHVHVLVRDDDVLLGATDRYALLYRKIDRVAESGTGDFEFTLSPEAVKFILGWDNAGTFASFESNLACLVIRGAGDAAQFESRINYPPAYRFLSDKPITNLDMEKGFTRFGVGPLKKMFSGCSARDQMNFGQHGETGNIAFWKDDRELGLIHRVIVKERSMPWS